jgi:hypothetical protein
MAGAAVGRSESAVGSVESAGPPDLTPRSTVDLIAMARARRLAS